MNICILTEDKKPTYYVFTVSEDEYQEMQESYQAKQWEMYKETIQKMYDNAKIIRETE